MPAVPQVWIHGAALSGATWGASLPAGALAPDLPGHGARPFAGETTVSAITAAVLPDLPARFDLLGHSLGGMVAMEIAAKHASRVRRLVLAETVMTTRSNGLERFASWFAVGLCGWLGPRRLARLSGIGQSPATAEALRTGIGALAPDVLDAAMRAATGFDGRALAARITAPTLVLLGAKNPRTHAQARALETAIAGARRLALPGGHMLHTDCPAALSAAVAQHFKDTP